MAITVANTDVTNTFDYWRQRTNELAYAMSNMVLTTGSSATIGDAKITGNFSAGSISVTSGLNGVTILPPSQAQILSNYVLSASGDWISGDGMFFYGSIPDGNPVLIDSWDASKTSAAEYRIHLKSGGSNNYSFSKISAVHDTGNSYITEYAMVVSNNLVGTLSSNLNSGIVRLYLSSVDGKSVNYKFTRGTL